MRCTNNSRRRKRRNRKNELRIRISLFFTSIILVFVGVLVAVAMVKASKGIAPDKYQKGIYTAETFASDICVTNEEVEFEEFYRHDEFHGALLFDIESQEVLYSEHAHERLYPASTTKIMTAYLALKYGNLDDYVTVSKNATNIPKDSSTAHLKAGDKLTLRNLLYSLMLPSGNDSAVAIAEHISGDVESFADLMNEEAKRLGATNTHFVNPHGYHDKDHYTTAYDLYLIFKECLNDETFIKIISSKVKEATVREANGGSRTAAWSQTNQFINGQRKVPNGITVIGGKTGNTFDAGSCLALYCTNEEGTPFIAIMMGASSKRNLYDNMTSLMRAIPNE